MFNLLVFGVKIRFGEYGDKEVKAIYGGQSDIFSLLSATDYIKIVFVLLSGLL